MTATADDASTPSLVVRQLAKSFGDVDVLRHIDFTMQKGEFLVLVGPSGCGKSTLLNCIAGLEEISSGTLTIAGRDVTHVPPRERDIAMVFQSYALYPTMSVADNIGFGMRIRKFPRKQITARVNAVAELLRIEPLLQRRPAELSGGQRQRVAMGRALVREPSLFLFDEPLSNLDAKLRVEMRAEIKRVHQSTDASIVYVTHDQIEALTLATRIVVLNAGLIQQIGTPQDIYERPANTFVADFMGSPAMNLVEAQIDSATSSVLFDDGQRLTVNLPTSAAESARVIVGLRPEVFSRAGNNRSADESVLEVKPTLVENAGADAYVGFELNQTPVTARLAGRFEQALHQNCSLAVDTRQLVFFDTSTEQRIAR